jgi:hypothetical protein
MTDTIMTVHEAINEVSKRVGGISKDGFNAAPELQLPRH